MECYCLFSRISWCVGVLNSAIFNSFHNRVEFGTILEGLQNFGGGGLNTPTPPSIRSCYGKRGARRGGRNLNKEKCFEYPSETSDFEYDFNWLMLSMNINHLLCVPADVFQAETKLKLYCILRANLSCSLFFPPN